MTKPFFIEIEMYPELKSLTLFAELIKKFQNNFIQLGLLTEDIQPPELFAHMAEIFQKNSDLSHTVYLKLQDEIMKEPPEIVAQMHVLLGIEIEMKRKFKTTFLVLALIGLSLIWRMPI